MEESRIFRTINRLNSILFLFLLIAALGFIAFQTFTFSNWPSSRAVEVTQNTNESTKESYQLAPDRVEQVSGHNVSYIALISKRRGGKLSGYSGGEMRNILFFVGDDLTPRWLFNGHENLVLIANQIKNRDRDSGEIKTKAFLLQVVFNDTNNDGFLTQDDDKALALSMPDGSRLTVLEENASVLNFKLSNNGKSVFVLYQQGEEVIYSNYSITKMQKISSRIITDISKKL